MITYNHEAFIAQAIEGVMMQQTSFPLRLVLGEDGSKDNTRAICIEYQKKYPGRILLLTDEGNLGMIPNFMRTLKACSSKYVALCEGDDYWTDPQKLQKQLDFMEANPDFAICFHRMQVVYEGDPSKNHLTNEEPDITTEIDLTDHNYIYTASCLFRNNLFREFPKSFCISPAGDYFLHMLNAKHGKIRFLNEPMGVYRVHDGGAWGQKPRLYQEVNWIQTQNLVSTEISVEAKNVINNKIRERMDNLATVYKNGTSGEKQELERILNSVFLNYLKLWDEHTECQSSLQKLSSNNEILRNQLLNDFNSPIRTFVRNLYYKVIGKNVFK